MHTLCLHTHALPCHRQSARPQRPGVRQGRWAIGAVLTLSLALQLPPPAWASADQPSPPTPIEQLDVPRYMGTWHELARYPNRFQARCTGASTARYSLQPDGTVQVLNQCPQANGQVDEALGQARQLGGTTSPRLQVRFAPAWLGWLPWVWGDYWVIDLDADYSLAAVSDAQRDYLWVLSRTPQVDEARYQALMARLRARGFEPERLQRNPSR